MTGELRPYPEYKDSGADWLGEIPAHWEIYPHRSLFTEVIERGYPDEEMLSVTISQGVIQQAQLLANSSKKDSSNIDKSSYKLVAKGDIAYNKMRAWQGAIGASAYSGIISPAYIIVRLRQEHHNIWYFHYLFRTPLFTTEAERWSYGITSDQWSLRYGEFKQIYSPLPPPDEQAAIVRFLDAAETRIRRYIRAKQKLIKLLDEQKQAIIQQAITRGLDPDVPMKNSGVEWLGQIPMHWEVLKVKREFKTTSGGTPDTSQQSLYYGGSIPWIRTMDLNNGIISNYEIGITQRAIADTACKIVPKGSVLIAMYGGAGTIGKNGLLGIDSTVNQAVCAILPSSQFEPEYVLGFMQSQRPYWMVGADGTRKDPNISQERIRESLIIKPPLSEQRPIVKEIKDRCRLIDEAINQLEAENTLIREYRTCLIAYVVTGKIDVRGAVFEIPEEFDEGDLLNVDEDELLEDNELEEMTDEGAD